MSDLISRQAVLESLKTDYSLIMFDSYGNLTFTGERIIEAIKRVPSVEQEREKGKWMRRKYTDAFKCSVCGSTPDYDDMVSTDDICVYRYCRWCGAKMEVNR